MSSIKKENKKTIIIKDRSWWHIRFYYKSGHGALVVGENESEYGFLNITTNPPIGYSYIETEKPINMKNNKSHIRLYIQVDKKKYLSKWIMKYKLSNKDLDAVEEYLETQKKKR